MYPIYNSIPGSVILSGSFRRADPDIEKYCCQAIYSFSVKPELLKVNPTSSFGRGNVSFYIKPHGHNTGSIVLVRISKAVCMVQKDKGRKTSPKPFHGYLVHPYPWITW